MYTVRTLSADNDFKQDRFTANIKCENILTKKVKVKLLLNKFPSIYLPILSLTLIADAMKDPPSVAVQV